MISRPTLAMTPRAIGSIMAAVPVLGMNGEVAAPMKPKAIMMRWVELPTQRSARMLNAKRRSRPWTSMASAMMKLPMNSRMVESNTLPNTSSALATSRTTHRHNPTTPVIGIGIASVIHQVTLEALLGLGQPPLLFVERLVGRAPLRLDRLGPLRPGPLRLLGLLDLGPPTVVHSLRHAASPGDGVADVALSPREGRPDAGPGTGW